MANSTQPMDCSPTNSSAEITLEPKDNSTLMANFECPVCFDHVWAPIEQCRNGHIVCNTCRPKVDKCPECRIAYSAKIRALPLEKMAISLGIVLKCSTCDKAFPFDQLTDHKEACGADLISEPSTLLNPSYSTRPPPPTAPSFFGLAGPPETPAPRYRIIRPTRLAFSSRSSSSSSRGEYESPDSSPIGYGSPPQAPVVVNQSASSPPQRRRPLTGQRTFSEDLVRAMAQAMFRVNEAETRLSTDSLIGLVRNIRDGNRSNSQNGSNQ